MFKILIIDDDSAREFALKTIFKHESFIIEFVFDKTSFFSNERSFENYDCIACDVSLDNWIDGGDTTNMFDTVIKTIGKKIPIVIFSSVVKEIITWTNKLIDEKYSLIYTIALQETPNENAVIKNLLSVESNQIICNNIYTLLQRNNNYSMLRKNPEDDLNILHISDLQFGDPNFNLALSKTFESVIKRSISNDVVPKIDFIAITGDITYNGKPSQYNEALVWIKNLCTSILGENYQDRLLLTPGNHDANLSLCALNHYIYHFPSKIEEEEVINFDKIERIDDYSIYSMDPFRDFAFKITKDNNWLECDSLSFFNLKYCYLGFKILHLNMNNPDKQLGKKNAIFELDNRIISDLRNCLSNNNRFIDLPTVILAHPSPKYLGYDLDEEHNNSWTIISNFFSEINSQLYIYGHRHKNLLKKELPLNTEKNMKISGTGTLLCEPDSGDRRGFKIIQVKRSKSEIIDIQFRNYDYRNDGTIKMD